MHGKALPVQQVGQRVAQCRLAAVADVQRAGRVGGDKLDQHLAVHALCLGAVAVALLQHRAQHIGLGGRRQAQVDKAGAGDFQAGHQPGGTRVGLDRVDDLLGQFPRVALERAGNLHGEVAGQVAVGGDLRTLEDGVGQGGVGRGDCAHRVIERSGKIGGLNWQHGCRGPEAVVWCRRGGSVAAAPSRAACGAPRRVAGNELQNAEFYQVLC